MALHTFHHYFLSVITQTKNILKGNQCKNQTDSSGQESFGVKYSNDPESSLPLKLSGASLISAQMVAALYGNAVRIRQRHQVNRFLDNLGIAHGPPTPIPISTKFVLEYAVIFWVTLLVLTCLLPKYGDRLATSRPARSGVHTFSWLVIGVGVVASPVVWILFSLPP